MLPLATLSDKDMPRSSEGDHGPWQGSAGLALDIGGIGGRAQAGCFSSRDFTSSKALDLDTMRKTTAALPSKLMPSKGAPGADAGTNVTEGWVQGRVKI